ncbi:hypothetical protein ACRJ4B_10070 [Streptomyces sp. GTA36]
MLCRKIGVPTADVRGNITSHRARSTIASQLYNAKEPMTLFELQEWLGHRTPKATAHYAKITPNTLARAYNDAGYLARNVRTIEVLVDCDAVVSGATASGCQRSRNVPVGACFAHVIDPLAARGARVRARNVRRGYGERSAAVFKIIPPSRS